MKFAFSFILTLIVAFGYAQGPQESFDAGCDCWTVINHFDNGQVSSKHTENAARKKHGEAATYNANGNLIRQEHWNNGKLHGTSTSYHHDGSLYLEANYDHGNKIGTWIFRDTAGTPTQEISYSGMSGDATYSHYYSGVKYIEQTVVNGEMVSSNILNQAIYDEVQEEASATSK
jgi:antitoxin component YwqK of YwqJK toxin-antitoxin module